jgi:hypothetical protein
MKRAVAASLHHRWGLVLAAVMICPAVWAQGLTVDEAAAFGPRLQTRIGLATSAPSLDGGGAVWQQQAGVVLGDYYFSRMRFGSGQVSGGFRATSGVLLGQRSVALGTPALAGAAGSGLTQLRQSRWLLPGQDMFGEPWSAVPYLGIGWSGTSARGGWGLSADFGFAGRSAGSGGLRINGNQSLDDLLRELRITPMLQVGVSYAF